MNSNMHLLATYTTSQELAIVRSILESEGIETFTRDELSVSIQPFASNAFGGIKLYVWKTDAYVAREILFETGHLEPMEPNRSIFNENLRPELSKKKEYNWMILLFFFLLVVLAIYILFID